MNPLADARSNMAAALVTAGFNAFSVIPPRVSPPFVSVAPGSPYIEYPNDPSLFFGEAMVRLTLVLVTAAGANDEQAAALDQMVVDVLAQRDRLAPFSVDTVDDPGRIAINGQDHLGVAINLVAPVQLGV